MKRVRNITKVIKFILIVSVIGIIVSIFYNKIVVESKTPRVMNGYLDLSSWDFTTDKEVFLNGSWLFYPDELLGPDALHQKEPFPIRVPRGWRSEDGSYEQPARGNGTYHLRVKLPKLEENMALKVQNIWMAHRIYINGVLIEEKGELSNKEEDFRGENTPYLLVLKPTQQLDLVIQVSNQVFLTGGIAQPIRLGMAAHMEAEEKIEFSVEMSEILLFFFFGIYHLQIYKMWHREKVYLYSGIYLLTQALSLATTGEKILMQLLPGLPFKPVYNFMDVFLIANFLALAFFIQSLEPVTIKRKNLILLLLPIIVFLGMVIVMPYQLYSPYKLIITLYADVILWGYALRFIQVSFYNKNRILPKNEAIYVVLCVVFVGISTIDFLLYYTGYVNKGLASELAMIGFLLSINLFLARRFTNKMMEIQVLSEQVIKSGEIKDEFLKRTSYELKKPLSGISDIAEYLLKEAEFSLPSQHQEKVEVIQKTAMKLNLLVSDLIDIIKLRHKDLEFKITSVDLYVIIEVMFELVKQELYSKEVKLVNQIKPMTFVQADENRLKQIVYNIAATAVEQTEVGEIRASVVEEGESCKLILSYIGVGLLEGQWEQLFNDFDHAELYDWEYRKGMGLGLYISRQLARRMGGDVWIVCSVSEKETAIALSLPKGQFLLEAQSSQVSTVTKQSIQRVNASPQISNRKHILLIDDDPTNIKLLSYLLEADYNLSVAYTVEEAMKLLESQKIELIILDIVMPGMSGIELTQRIRQTYSSLELPIIISTLRGDEKEVELAYQSGANDYITKPFSTKEIQWRVRSLLKLTDTMEQAYKNEVAFLQAQIKPHFIYNALSNIIALCYEDGERAAKFLALLSQYLRYIFQLDKAQQFLSLQNELELISVYVEIEKLRFGDRLRYKTSIEPSLLEKRVSIPALLIQPLVENAIRHGLFNKNGNGTVVISAMSEDDSIRIVVEDDGIGMSEDEVYRLLNEKNVTGVGIQNIRRRMNSYAKASFSIDSKPEEGTKCTLVLPKEMF